VIEADPAHPAATAADLVLGRSGDGAIGLVFEDQTWTWAEVVEQSVARAAWMKADRRPGPFHVGVLLENVPEYLFLLAGAALCGATVVGLNPTRRGAELARDVRHTDCQVVITDTERAEKLRELQLGPAAGHVIDCSGSSYLAAVSDHFGAAPPSLQPDEQDLFLLIFTSGSTGEPKAVRVSHGRAARSAIGMRFRPVDVLYSAMPMFHGNALFASVLPAWHTGCRLVLRRRFSASAFLDDVRTYKCTYFNTVGRAIAHINATPPSGRDRDHDLKWVLGPETSEADKAAFTARFGVPVIDGYGSSENAVILHPATGARPGALGVAPAGTDIAVVDAETLTECEVARFDDGGRLLNAGKAIGELVGRNSGDRFEGYYNDPDAESSRLRNGWYWSGDLAYRDGDGVFYFAGRSGDWLRVDSENFAAGPVERILARAPGVSGVAVYPVPDARTGDQVMAALEIANEEAFDPDLLSAFLSDQPDFSPKWAPTYIRVVTALPVTATDKVDKRPLRSARWRTTDPVWRRPPRSMRFERMGQPEIEALEAEFDANGRANLLQA
jgi:acyl-CoA synthetase (AMP-forming)/AMP-acid ligase II